ncbi:MAG: hypothetical protein ISR34_11015 [Pirellulales bacterium]|nr:hypothetical protein [Pirellulales bacterium]
MCHLAGTGGGAARAHAPFIQICTTGADSGEGHPEHDQESGDCDTPPPPSTRTMPGIRGGHGNEDDRLRQLQVNAKNAGVD